MSVTEQRRSGPLFELRIRLEGALETVEAGAARYAALDKALSAGRWRKLLRAQPDLIDEVLRSEGALREARARCEKLAAKDDAAGPLSKVAAKLSESRGALHRTVLRRLRANAELSLEDALATLGRKLLGELPGDLRSGERRLLDGGGDKRGFIAALGMLWILGIGAGPLFELIGGDAQMWGAFAAVVAFAALFWAPFIVSWQLSGRYTLTNQRLIFIPRRGDPVQVELSALKPGGLKISPVLGWIKVDSLVPFSLRGVQEPWKLAGYVEVLRWMSLQTAAAIVAEPFTDVAIFPAVEGEEVPFGEDATTLLTSGVAVMRPQYAAHFRGDRAEAVLRAITGSAPGPVDLEAALKLLKQLGAAKFDEAIRAAAQQEGALLERPPSAIVSQGPVRQHLVVRGPSRAFAAKIQPRHLDEVEPMAAKWRAAP